MIFEFVNGKTLCINNDYIIKTKDKNSKITQSKVDENPIIRHGTKEKVPLLTRIKFSH